MGGTNFSINWPSEARPANVTTAFNAATGTLAPLAPAVRLLLPLAGFALAGAHRNHRAHRPTVREIERRDECESSDSRCTFSRNGHTKVPPPRMMR